MVETQSRSSLVIAGAWNQHIISPPWLKENSFTTLDQVEVAVEINNPLTPIIVKLENVRITVSSAQVIINPLTDSPESYESSDSTAQKLLELLLHTPLSGLGYNFHFIENEPERDLLELFNWVDDDKFIDNGAISKTKVLKRELKFDTKLLNLTQTLKEDNSILFDLNWHFDCSKSSDAVTIIDANKYADLREKTYEIIKNIYSIDISEES